MKSIWFVAHATFVVLLGVAPAFAKRGRGKPHVKFMSECECVGQYGSSREVAKRDASPVPWNYDEVHEITPSEISAWSGPGSIITNRSQRLPSEEAWYSLSGRVEDVKIEEDGDVHFVLADVNNRRGKVIVEIPLGVGWCAIRKKVFSWTAATFPWRIGKRKAFDTLQHPIVTVVGKAFYDIDHCGKDTRNNRRPQQPAIAVWEIHPVMQLKIEDEIIDVVPSAPEQPAITDA